MKQFFAILFLMVSLTPSFGQSSVGVELGMNLLKVSDSVFGNEFQPGWYGGLAYSYNLNTNLSVQSGIYFSQGKHSYEAKDTALMDLLASFMGDSMAGVPGIDLNTYTTTNSRVTQHYLQIPINANYRYKNIDFFGGCYVGFMIGAKRIDYVQESTPFMAIIDLDSLDPTGFISSFLPKAYDTYTVTAKETEGLNAIDFGFNGGIGYTMDRVGFRASYSYGITDYRSDPTGDLQSNHFFRASIRYMIPIGEQKSASSIK